MHLFRVNANVNSNLNTLSNGIADFFALRKTSLKLTLFAATICLAMILFADKVWSQSPGPAMDQNPLDLSITARDHYTRSALDSVRLSLFFEGTLLDSTVTGTDGRALLRIRVTGTDHVIELPHEFTLSHNYPNPFLTETRVDVGVPEPQSVRLEIFNVLGQRVATQQVHMEAGSYSLNLSLGHLPVGVYFLRVGGRDAKVEKMIKMSRTFTSAGPVFQVEPTGTGLGNIARPSDVANSVNSAAATNDAYTANTAYTTNVANASNAVNTAYTANASNTANSANVTNVATASGASRALRKTSPAAAAAGSYLLRAVRSRYQPFETHPDLDGHNADLLVEMRRNNIVSITTVNPDQEPVSLQVRVSGEQFNRVINTPETLVMDSGIYTVASTSDSLFVINDFFEIPSLDSAYVIRPFIPQEAEITGRVANERQEFVSGARVVVHRDGVQQTTTTTAGDGTFSVTLLADGSMYSLVIYPDIPINGFFDPESYFSFSPDAQVITPRPGGSYSLEFLLYEENPLVIPGGNGSLPVGPYTLANREASVMVANIPPELGIVGGSARAYSPTTSPDAFPGEFATRQPGFESALISGGFASVNLLRSDGSGGVEPISELRDAMGNPVQVTLRFLMDPMDYHVLRDPASLSHLPGFINRPDTIDVPLYYYDEPSGDWLLSPQFGWLEDDRGAISASELERIRDGEYERPVYVTGLVDHFTWYNLDYPGARACLTGRLVDQNSDAVKFGKMTFRSLPELAGRSFFSNTHTFHTDDQGYFKYVGPRTERNSGDDWNNNNRIDNFYAQGEYADKNSCGQSIFDNNGRGFLMPQFPEEEGCGNIGTLRMNIKEAKKEQFKIFFRDIERDGVPGKPLFVHPDTVNLFNYSFATLTDLKIPLMGDIWNCVCDISPTLSECNRVSATDESGKTVFTIPVMERESHDIVQLNEKLVGQVSYRKMRPDLGEDGYEFAHCAFLTKTKPPKEDEPPIEVECEIFFSGRPVIEIVSIEGEVAPPQQRDFLYDERVTLEASGTDVNGNSIDDLDLFYWTNELETLFIAPRRIVTLPAHQLFGTGTGLSIRAHGIDRHGFKGDTLAAEITVADVQVLVRANQEALAVGTTTVAIAQVTGAMNTGVRWQSLNPQVASVSNFGLVQGHQPGTAIIRAQSLADLSKLDEVELSVIHLVADFSVDPAAGDSLTEFTFDASTSIGDISAYEWDFGDGTTDDGQIVTHVFGTPGVFNVTLTVTGDFGLQASQTHPVSTIGIPLAIIQADPETGAAPLQVFFDGRSSASPNGQIVQFDWNFGDGNAASGDTVTHVYELPGSYMAILTVMDNDDISAADSISIQVFEAPVAEFTVTPDEGNPPLQVVVDASGSSAPGGNIVNYHWNFDDGTIIESGLVSETHVYTEAGVYGIELTITTDAGLSAVASRTVNVGCDVFEGDILVNSQQQLDFLQTLCRINGNVEITNLQGVENLPDFNNLAGITGGLWIYDNDDLQNISGFDNLDELSGLEISNNPALIRIEGFSKLKDVSDISISGNPALVVVSGFDQLESTSNLTFSDNALLSQIPFFGNLVNVNDQLIIQGTSIVSINGFNRLENVESLLDITSNNNLTAIRGFNAFETSGSLVIIGNPVLIEISAFSNMKHARNFFIQDNSVLSALDTFDNLEKVDFSYRISNTNISSCEILEKVRQLRLKGGLEGTTVQVSGNPDAIAGSYLIQTQAHMDGLAGICQVGTLTVNTSLPAITGVNDLMSVGTLQLNVNQNITDLSSFEKLFEAVTLNITSNNNLTSLNGLDQLIRVANLNISGNSVLSDISSLGNIKNLLNLNIISSPALASLAGLEAIEQVNNLDFTSLQGLQNLEGLSGLREIRNQMRIHDTGLADFSGLELSATAPQNRPRIIISGNQHLTDLTGLDNLNTISETSIISNPSLQSLNGLQNVTSVNGSLFITNNSQLKNLNGLDNLEQITFSTSRLLISSNNSLESLDGLQKLVSVPQLSLENSQALVNIDALSSLSSVSSLVLNNLGISDVDALSGITGNLASLTLAFNPNLTDLDGLSGITGSMTNLNLSTNPNLTELGGLSGITSVTNSLSITGNNALANLDGFAGLTSVGTLTIQSNPNLSDISGMSGITTVTSSLDIVQNNALMNLDGLSGLETVGLTLNIRSNPSLVSISGMNALRRINFSLFVTENTALPTCDAERLRDQVLDRDGIGGIITISDNDDSGVCEPG